MSLEEKVLKTITFIIFPRTLGRKITSAFHGNSMNSTLSRKNELSVINKERQKNYVNVGSLFPKRIYSQFQGIGNKEIRYVGNSRSYIENPERKVTKKTS